MSPKQRRHVRALIIEAAFVAVPAVLTVIGFIGVLYAVPALHFA